MKRTPILAVILVSAALLLTSCPNPLSSGPSSLATGGIQGFARYAGQSHHGGILVSAESVNGRGITGAVSEAIRKGGAVSRAAATQVITGTSGSYTLEGLEAGTYTVYASSPDSREKAVTTSVTVEPGRSVSAGDLNLTPTGGVSGNATLAGGSSGNVGIMVFIAGTSFSAMTDDGGSYALSGVPAAAGYVLVASRGGYDSAITNVDVAGGTTTKAGQLDLPLHVNAATTGGVGGIAKLDGASSGNSGIVVYLVGTSYLATSDDQGNFSLTGVTAGSYTVMASRSGYSRASAGVAVSAGNTANAGTLSLTSTAPVSAPTFAPGPGQYASDQGVTLQTATSGATIYYTTDFSEPTTSSSVYSAPISVAGTGANMTIKAMAVKSGMSDSYVTSATYSVNYSQVAAPTFSTVLPGRFTTVQVVSLACATPGATVRYTTDGSQPTQVNGTSYTAPIAVAAGTTVTIRAYAFKAGSIDSTQLAGTFTVTNPFVYVAGYGSNNVLAYRINTSTGALTAAGTTAAGTNPVSIVVDPTGKFAYAANIVSGNVFGYTINSGSGALASMGTPVSAGSTPDSVAIGPTGRFLYVANNGSNDISMFAIDSAAGTLSSIGPTVAAGTNPSCLAIDPTGRFLYASNQGSNNLSAYSIDSGSGVLSPVGSPVSTDANPLSICIDPAGKFLYAANNASGTVTAYGIDSATGALTSAGAPLAAGTNPYSIAVEATGRFVYESNLNSSNIFLYRIDSATGALTSLGPTTTASGISSVAVEPTGRFLYATGFNPNNVSAYTINSSTGALTLVGAVAAGTNPVLVTTTH